MDACAVVGSTSMAALHCEMNPIAFDSNSKMVAACKQRVNNFDNEPTPSGETNNKPKKKTPVAAETLKADVGEPGAAEGVDPGPSAAHAFAGAARLSAPP
ncbi:hypothetical protein CYMTET_49632 [Cymbomonas tetramitiformis]|uniref:Uncharacterized protein n=1 Tax=Cymbomonas tetramitiformis TaxID=36881 RepID=A0AAE0EUI0_9CHLO|nr:hypothetical protein CYMTET_49632 [Cymbomonas tetramitiformis]|eukprot:gene3673-4608_t